MTKSKCDSCEKEHEWFVYAAYDIEDNGGYVEDALLKGSMPIIRACNDRLSPLLSKDRDGWASKKKWVVVGERRRQTPTENIVNTSPNMILMKWDPTQHVPGMYILDEVEPENNEDGFIPQDITVWKHIIDKLGNIETDQFEIVINKKEKVDGVTGNYSG